MQSATGVTHLRYRLTESPELVTLITLIIIFAFFSVAADNFLTMSALSNVLTFASINGVIVLGVATLMISGEFDLSVGATLAVAGYVFVIAINSGVAPLLAAALALAVSMGLGLINGIVVTRTGIPSFITTVGTMLAFRGIARAIGGGNMIAYTGERPALFLILNGAVAPLNEQFQPPANFRASTVWFIGLAAVMTFMLMRTRYGNWVYATGGNPGAARAQGVNVARVKITNFVLCGLLAGFAGVVQFAHRSSIDQLRGEGLELVAVAAAVIGGVRLTGGVGTLPGACLGVLLLSMLEQGLVLMRLPIQVFQATAGAILIISVAVNTYLSHRE
ncbi:MAG: ABC transporter permease [Anaerolineae bacterium]|nr:ABC transporter permease [Anaerolineae bacterium]